MNFHTHRILLFTVTACGLFLMSGPGYGYRTMEVTFSPAQVHADETDSVRVQVRTGSGVRRVYGRAVGGELGKFTSCGAGCFSAPVKIAPPAFPRALVVLVWAKDHAGAGVLPVSSRTVLPVKTEPDADVLLEVAGKEYGPFFSGRSGEIEVEVDVPAGTETALVRVRDRVGHTSTRTVDLKIPTMPRIVLKAMKTKFRADGKTRTVILAAGAAKDGTPVSSIPDVESDLVEITEVARPAPGLAVIKLRSGTVAGRGSVTVGMRGAGSRKIVYSLEHGEPAGIRITTDPPVLSAGADRSSTVRVDLVDEFYNLVPDKKPVVKINGGVIVEEIPDESVFSAKVKAAPEAAYSDDASIRIQAEWGRLFSQAEIAVIPPSGYWIVLVPGRDTMTADGRSSIDVGVEVMDSMGNRVDGAYVDLEGTGLAIPDRVQIKNGFGRFGATALTRAGHAWIRASLRGSTSEKKIRLMPGPPDEISIEASQDNGKVNVRVCVEDVFANPVILPEPRLTVDGVEHVLIPLSGEGCYRARVNPAPSSASISIEASSGRRKKTIEYWIVDPWLAGLRIGYMINLVDILGHNLNTFLGFPFSVEFGYALPVLGRRLLVMADVSYIYIQSELYNRRSEYGYDQILEIEMHAMEVALGARYYFIKQSTWLPYVELLAGFRALKGDNINRPGQGTEIKQTVFGFTWSLHAAAGIEMRLGPGRLLLDLRYIESPTDMPSQFSDDYRFRANAGGLTPSVGYRVTF